jgi:hypothetical protein
MVLDEVIEIDGDDEVKQSNSKEIIQFPPQKGVIVGYEYIPGKGIEVRRKYIDTSRPGKTVYPSMCHYG